jgi:hypothetical protein
MAIGILAIVWSLRVSAETIELSCKFGEKGGAVAVFVTDMAKREGKQVNADAVLEGKLDIEETFILLEIDKQGLQVGTRLRVNRFTGEAVIEEGDAPFALDAWPGTGNAGNTIEAGSCVAGAEKKLF